MKTYTSFAKSLTKLLSNDQAVKLTVDGYMPLPQSGKQSMKIFRLFFRVF